MEGFEPRTSFGYDESRRYDAVDTVVMRKKRSRFSPSSPAAPTHSSLQWVRGVSRCR
jgi:hypothetical protein